MPAARRPILYAVLASVLLHLLLLTPVNEHADSSVRHLSSASRIDLTISAREKTSIGSENGSPAPHEDRASRKYRKEPPACAGRAICDFSPKFQSTAATESAGVPVGVPEATAGNSVATPLQDAEDERSYRIALARAARALLEAGSYGTISKGKRAVDVSLVFSASGSVMGSGIAKSSGDSRIDQSARELMLEAARQGPLLQNRPGRPFSLSISLEFGAD